MLFALVLALSLSSILARENSCASAGLCCKRRDSACVSQAKSNETSVDTSKLPCYCDQACRRLQDCCHDYDDYCKGEAEGGKIVFFPPISSS